MLNRVILMGRIAHDLELKQTQNGVSVLSFTVAVDRGYVKQGEERQTDFITCVTWRQRAELINKHFAKGRMIAVDGSLQTRIYEDKNDIKHYITEVIVDRVSFTGEPKKQSNATNPAFKPPAKTVDDDDIPEDEEFDIEEFETVISDGEAQF